MYIVLRQMLTNRGYTRWAPVALRKRERGKKFHCQPDAHSRHLFTISHLPFLRLLSIHLAFLSLFCILQPTVYLTETSQCLSVQADQLCRHVQFATLMFQLMNYIRNQFFTIRAHFLEMEFEITWVILQKVIF